MDKKLIEIVEAKKFKDFWFDLHEATTENSSTLLGEMLFFREEYNRITGTSFRNCDGMEFRYNFIKLMLTKKHEEQLKNYYVDMNGVVYEHGEGI
ncbi:MAG: hypothetical protein AABX29_04010 [Nanoarchaeota archaeon]